MGDQNKRVFRAKTAGRELLREECEMMATNDYRSRFYDQYSSNHAAGRARQQSMIYVAANLT